MPKTVTKISKRELETRLSAAREIFPHAFPGFRRPYMKDSTISKLSKSRRSLLSMLLPPQFDTNRFGTLQKECSLELDRIGKARRAAAIKASPRLKKTLRAYMANERKELDSLERPALLDPFLIWGRVHSPTFSTLSFDFDLKQHWAKMTFTGKGFGDPGGETFDTAELSFFYMWTNDTNYPIRISADSTLFLNGFSQATADGFWGVVLGSDSNTADLVFGTILRAWQWWTNPPIPFPGSPHDVLSHPVEGPPGVKGGVGGDTKEASIVAANHFSVSNIEIPPRGSIVFEVSLLSTYLFNGSGKILVDFASGSFELISAYMSLSIGRPQFPRPPFPMPL